MSEINQSNDDRLIDSIEAARRKNNMNWMDILRIALKHAPEETKAVLRKINEKDSQISSLLKDLTDA